MGVSIGRVRVHGAGARRQARKQNQQGDDSIFIFPHGCFKTVAA
jgi:hypothetical protein